ncbi:DUF2478 domain-containing protein [Aliidiomarina taiwanensis]|nr:DUF2478 domain-containing protein [Aliidiomarina taiwanensis]
MVLPAAAVLHKGDGEGDALLASIIQQYQQQGWCIQGLLTEQGKDMTSKKPMALRDIQSGEVFVISQYRGRDARGCSLDLGGLSEAGKVLRNVLNDAENGSVPDLVFINRFGHGETQGKGLSSEFAELISAGIPVLTLVSEKYLDAWQTFAGELAEILPLEREVIEGWLHDIQKLNCHPNKSD